MEHTQIREILWQNILRYEKHIADTNTKASYLITANVFLMGIAFSAFVSDTSRIHTVISAGKLTYGLFLLFMLLGAISTAKSFSAVFPNTKKDKGAYKEKSFLFFGDVENFPNGKLIDNISEKISNKNDIHDFEAQCIIMAEIVSKKFTYIKQSFHYLKYQSISLLVLLAVFTVYEAIKL